jgi:ATP-dependent Lon protease
MPILLGPSKKQDKKTIPLVTIREGVIFPHTEAILSFGRPSSIAGINAAFNNDRSICFVTQKNPRIDNPRADDIYQVGTLATIERVLKTNNEVNALVKGIKRVKIEHIAQSSPFLMAEVTEIGEIVGQPDKTEALRKHVTAEFKKAVNLGKNIDFLIFMKLMSGVEASELADQIATNLDLKTSKKQELLEQADVTARLEKVSQALAYEIKILEIERTIDNKTQRKFDKSMRQTVLKERMKTIQKELGQDREGKEITDLKKQIFSAKMPEEVEVKALKELKKLSDMQTYNPEYGYIRNYLDWLVELPWSLRSPNNVSIIKAETILNEDHYGLKEIKERILEYLAVMQLKKTKSLKKKDNKDVKNRIRRDNGTTILCFVGPPGVGKTSIGRSIARALNREFVKISLGGIRDEAEIRGHRRTYVGSMPGRIIQGIRNAKTKNPVFMLDEIDKVGTDFRGDPSSALLEALDPEQNHEFSDHYLEVPFDLSEVMFITTANILDTIPPALMDRLEIIRFSGYTEDEKFKIADKYLVSKSLRAAGLDDRKIEITDEALKTIIKNYTREAGVRNLEREIFKILRKMAWKISQRKLRSGTIKNSDISDYLGPSKFLQNLAEKKDEVGMVTGLAWTQAGGDILFIEVALMPGKGNLILTGNLGQVMKESCRAALSYVRSNWKKLGIRYPDFYKKWDIHVHVPEGAVPKDGPSAGIAIATALVSALTKKKIRRELGMTGEVTLRGRVLEIGGVKEKVIAGHRSGLKTIILPKTNQKDMINVPDNVIKDIKFVFVNDLDEVWPVALAK